MPRATFIRAYSLIPQNMRPCITARFATPWVRQLNSAAATKPITRWIPAIRTRRCGPTGGNAAISRLLPWRVPTAVQLCMQLLFLHPVPRIQRRDLVGFRQCRIVERVLDEVVDGAFEVQHRLADVDQLARALARRASVLSGCKARTAEAASIASAKCSC